MQNKSMKREHVTQERNIRMEYNQRQKDLLEEIMIQSNMSYSKIMHHMDVYGFKKRFISGPDEGLLEEIFNSIFMPYIEARPQMGAIRSMETVSAGGKRAR